MPESNDNLGCKILHRLPRLVRQRAWSRCHLLHGLGSVEVNSQLFCRSLLASATTKAIQSAGERKNKNVCGLWRERKKKEKKKIIEIEWREEMRFYELFALVKLIPIN
jgi:hypothetical protein